MSDPIADLVIRIKNAQASNKEQVIVPYSKFKVAIVEVMKKNGFISEFKKQKDSQHEKDNLLIKFSEKRVSHFKRLSKPGQRLYIKGSNIPRPLRGFGLVIISTPKGVLSGHDARKRQIGGELICEVW